MLSTLVGRRIVGFVSALLLVAFATLLFRVVLAPTAGSYEVEAILGRAGAGLSPGSDVKVRGVNVGEITGLRYEETQAIATILFDPEPCLPREDMELRVTAKTLLGEKQIELSFPEDAFDQPPCLAEGDVLVAIGEPTELQEVVNRLGDLLEPIDPNELALVVEALSAMEGEEDVIVGNLEVGRQLFDFANRTADDTIDRLSAFRDIAAALAPVTDQITRSAELIRPATRVLVERTADLDGLLNTLSQFAIGLSEFLEVNEQAIARGMFATDMVGAVLERNMTNVSRIVDGIARYASGFREGGALDDGTEYAYFRILIGGDDTRSGSGASARASGGNWLERLCRDSGPVSALIPACAEVAR